MPRLNSGRNATGECLIAHDASIDFHALGIAYQLWRRIQRGLEPLTMKNGSRKTRSRSLAIGTGDLNAIEILVRSPSSSSISTTVSSRGPASPEIRPVSAASPTASSNESNSNENGTEYDPERLAITQSPLNIKRGPNQQRAPPIQNISQTPLCSEIKATTKWP